MQSTAWNQSLVKKVRHGSRNMFVFSSRIFDRGWFAGNLIDQRWLCHNSPLHPPLPALKNKLVHSARTAV